METGDQKHKHSQSTSLIIPTLSLLKIVELTLNFCLSKRDIFVKWIISVHRRKSLVS